MAMDLKGFTQDCRPGIFALRAAPIQINYLGYPGTMACDDMDYLIADEVVIPKESQHHYSEQILYMPGGYQLSQKHRKVVEKIPTRSEVGLPETGFAYCCINTLKHKPEALTPNDWSLPPRVPNEDHLARHALADFFLDTFPYSVHTTASDALFMGLPMVTMMGESFASRVAGKLVSSNLNLISTPQNIKAYLNEARLKLKQCQYPKSIGN